MWNTHLKWVNAKPYFSPLGTCLTNVRGVIPQLLTAHGSTKHGQKVEDDAAMLQQICAVNAEAGVWFLEHLVLQKQRMVGPLLTPVHSPVPDIWFLRIQSFTPNSLSRTLTRSSLSSPTTRYRNC